MAMPRWTSAYHTACQIQKKILEAMGLEFQQANRTPKPVAGGGPKLKPSELKQLADSWSTLEDRKRVLRMRGLPKPVESKEREKKPTRAVFTE